MAIVLDLEAGVFKQSYMHCFGKLGYCLNIFKARQIIAVSIEKMEVC